MHIIIINITNIRSCIRVIYQLDLPNIINSIKTQRGSGERKNLFSVKVYVCVCVCETDRETAME